MTNSLSDSYFKWLCSLIDADRYFPEYSYHMLLCYLDDVEFEYSIPMDANRAEDGVNLRYHFKYRTGIPLENDILDDRPCSVLEVLVALAVRCESQIMADPDYGDRTAKWFWDMIDNLGLFDMDDDHFSAKYVNRVIDRFLNREYEADGKGGLFTIDNCPHDLRDVELWYQLNWYLNSIQ